MTCITCVMGDMYYTHTPLHVQSYITLSSSRVHVIIDFRGQTVWITRFCITDRYYPNSRTLEYRSVKQYKMREYNNIYPYNNNSSLTRKSYTPHKRTHTKYRI